MPAIMKIAVTGMRCDGCVKAVEDALAALRGVSNCTVEVGEVELTYDEAQTDKKDVLTAIREAGAFEVEGFSTTA